MQLPKLILAFLVLALASHSAFGRLSNLKQKIDNNQSEEIEFVDSLEPQLIQTHQQVDASHSAEADSVDHHEAEEVHGLTPQTTASVAKLVAQAAAKAAVPVPSSTPVAAKAAAPAPAVPVVHAAAPVAKVAVAAAPVAKVAVAAVPVAKVAAAAAQAPIGRSLIHASSDPITSTVVPQPGVTTTERQAESALFTTSPQGLPFVNGPVPTPNPPTPFVAPVAAANQSPDTREHYVTPQGFYYYYDDASHGIKEKFPQVNDTTPASVTAANLVQDSAIAELVNAADAINKTDLETAEIYRGQVLVDSLSNIAKEIVGRDTSYVRLQHIVTLLNVRNTQLVQDVANKANQVKQLSLILEEMTNAINKAKDAVSAVATTSLLL